MRNKSKIKIRYCKPSELVKIISLTAKAYIVPYKTNGAKKGFYETLEKIEKDIGKGMKILVAEKDNNLIGAVRFVPIDSKLKLGRLAVLSKYRRKGLGSKLVKAVLNIALKENFKIVALDVMEEKELVSFYEKFGFKVKSRKKHQNHHDIFMEKKI